MRVEHDAETGQEVLLIKGRGGRVIGFERLNYEPPAGAPLQVGLVEA